MPQNLHEAGRSGAAANPVDGMRATASARRDDAHLRAAIARRRRRHPEFWSFAQTARARDGHVLFQYPAMMVAPMQGKLLDLVCRSRERRDSLVYDPFLGSATTMIEAMRRGLPFVGSDINPLAILLAKVESAASTAYDVDTALHVALRRAQAVRRQVSAPEEHWCVKWFRDDVAADLTVLAHAIRQEPELEIRRLFWATLAEIVRVSGNMRISAPKLQTRPPHELCRPLDVLGAFERLATRNVAALRERAQSLAVAGLFASGRYLPGLTLQIHDVREPPEVRCAADVVLTSPPYGDNDTTIPYGQASYLPLRWIELDDIADGIDREPLQRSKTLDTHSLGGSHRLDPDAGQLAAHSETLAAVLHRLELESDGWRRVAGFARDLDLGFGQVLECCAPEAHLVITIGDRTVRGVPVPTSAILVELLARRDVRLVDHMARQIPLGKRLARRNATSATIGEETVLILRAPR